MIDVTSSHKKQSIVSSSTTRNNNKKHQQENKKEKTMSNKSEPVVTADEKKNNNNNTPQQQSKETEQQSKEQQQQSKEQQQQKEQEENRKAAAKIVAAAAATVKANEAMKQTMVHCSFPPPKRGRVYSKRETVDILSTIHGTERSKLIDHWIDKKLIPVNRRQIYALLKKVEDGEIIYWSKPWKKAGRNPRKYSTAGTIGLSVHKMTTNLDVIANNEASATAKKKAIANMRKEIEEMRVLGDTLRTQQLKSLPGNNGNNNSGGTRGTRGGASNYNDHEESLTYITAGRKKEESNVPKRPPSFLQPLLRNLPTQQKRPNLAINNNNNSNNNKNNKTSEESSPPPPEAVVPNHQPYDVVPPPSNGSVYSRQEAIDILWRLKGKERSTLISSWVENGLIPINRRQVYSLLKKVQDGEEIIWSRPWKKSGRNPTKQKSQPQQQQQQQQQQPHDPTSHQNQDTMDASAFLLDLSTVTPTAK